MTEIQKAVQLIRDKGANYKPIIGIILGSGLGSFGDSIKESIVIPYQDLDGFPETGVEGHGGRLILGRVNGTEVCVLQGRAHYYENGKANVMKVPVQTLAELGCEILILTNAAGSLNVEAQPGSVMLVTDHINFTGVSPLFGAQGNSRFVNMVDAYDTDLRAAFQEIANQNKIKLHAGVYIWYCGPSFETPAEIRTAKTLGAQAVGMSTVPEVILARYFGLKVAALSVITNMAAGMANEELSHEQTIETAASGAEDLKILLTEFLKRNKS